ncbi:hypothetical protein CONLIGDRAFT_646146 [Coniochaeta ligniaria NRRL 30616]|uniref:Uncharacterized protein n=1 Tax=Coniochaeta ligniaria NRRL 30616 TaxID=1408157 RepID=A0A1J7IKW9_9PEZI|nr:hypothetical protein CONLIGDRAFT_646146 [Coniochaeta ligniaria NRRL 30616]
MPSSTPDHSPSAPGPSTINPTMPGISVVDSTTPSNTPGWLERRNIVIARSQQAESTPTNRTEVSRLEKMLQSPRIDLYFNRPQHQIGYLFIIHIVFFFFVWDAQRAGRFKDSDGKDTRVNAGLYFAVFDEIGPFCLYTAFALLECRNWRTVARWEFIAMAVSWAKSIVVLVWTFGNIKAGSQGPVKFPATKWDLVLFFLVRFLVFGGLWKMVQAGLNKRWERSWVPPPRRPTPAAARVARPHRAVPVRLQRRVGPGVRRQRTRRDMLDTLEGRRAYWAEIRGRGWILHARGRVESRLELRFTCSGN